MRTEDLIPAGERAKRHLRVAQALALLGKSRSPSLGTVLDALARVKGPQPAVAMAIILEYAKRQPRHERREWLIAAGEALKEYRLGDDADQKEADLTWEHIERETSLCVAATEKRERLRERLSLATLGLLVAAILSVLFYFGYTFAQGIHAPEKESAKTSTGKPVADNRIQAEPEDKRGAEKAVPAGTKKTDTESKAAKPAGK